MALSDAAIKNQAFSEALNGAVGGTSYDPRPETAAVHADPRYGQYMDQFKKALTPEIVSSYINNKDVNSQQSQMMKVLNSVSLDSAPTNTAAITAPNPVSAPDTIYSSPTPTNVTQTTQAAQNNVAPSAPIPNVPTPAQSNTPTVKQPTADGSDSQIWTEAYAKQAAKNAPQSSVVAALQGLQAASPLSNRTLY